MEWGQVPQKDTARELFNPLKCVCDSYKLVPLTHRFSDVAKVGFKLIPVLVIAYWYKQLQNNKCLKIKHCNPLDFFQIHTWNAPRFPWGVVMGTVELPALEGGWLVWAEVCERVCVCMHAHTCTCWSRLQMYVCMHNYLSFYKKSSCVNKHKRCAINSSFVQFRKTVLVLKSKLTSKIPSVHLFPSQAKVFLLWSQNICSLYKSNLFASFSLHYSLCSAQNRCLLALELPLIYCLELTRTL